MKRSIKRGGQAYSISGGLVFSATVNMFITFLFSVIIAYALNKEKITWEDAGYWIMGMLFSASFLGAKTAVITVKHQKMIISIMSGVLYWGLLLCITALFFGGNWSSIGETAAIIIAGCGCAALLSVPDKKQNKRRQNRQYC